MMESLGGSPREASSSPWRKLLWHKGGVFSDWNLCEGELCSMSGGGILFHKGSHWVGDAYCRDGGLFTASCAHPRLYSPPGVSFQ